jgi:hypothetical protein
MAAVVPIQGYENRVMAVTALSLGAWMAAGHQWLQFRIVCSIVAASPNRLVQVLQIRKRDMHSDTELAQQLSRDGGLKSHRAHLAPVDEQFVHQAGKLQKIKRKEI